jgi:predicted HicB family RNase H-like nuclease
MKPRSAASQRWNKKNYDEFTLRFPKGEKEIVREAAEANTGGSTSLNGYILEAIKEKMQK